MSIPESAAATEGHAVLALSPDDAHRRLPELVDVLVDCVQGGASVSFMLPFEAAEATAFFQSVIADVAAGTTVLLAALDESGRAAGTVQLKLAWQPNQPHRAGIAKLLVHRRARGRGMGAALMQRAESE